MSLTNDQSIVLAPIGSSRFETLPAEIRDIIYSYLGYPLGGHLYEDCNCDLDCKFKVHVVFHEDDRWPMWAHAYSGVFENRVRVAQLKFRDGTASSSPFTSLSYMLDGRTEAYKRLDIETDLLGVSKSIRDELLSLLFGKINVLITYPMSHEAIYLGPYIPDEVIYQPLRILPSTLGCIKSITFARKDSSVRGSLPGLELDADSIKFFAKHCPHLVQFTYHPDQEDVLNCRDEYLGNLSKALQDLVRTCCDLKILKIEYLGNVTHTDEQDNIGTSTERVVKKLVKSDMARVFGWSSEILEHLQAGAGVFKD